MKQNLTIVLLSILLCVTLTLAASSVNRSTHPDHPGKCWSEGRQQAYNPGEHFRGPNECAKRVCRADLMTSVSKCGTVIARPPCVLGAPDLTKDYPACCPKVVC